MKAAERPTDEDRSLLEVQRVLPGETTVEAAASAISESESFEYIKGGSLLSLFRLREQCRQLLAENYSGELTEVHEVVRELAPDNPDIWISGRKAVLRISGYQVWDSLVHDNAVVDRRKVIGLVMAGVGSALGAFIYFANGSSPWMASLYFVIATITAGTVLAFAFYIMKSPIPSSIWMRDLLGLLGLLGIIGGAFLLFRWTTFLGRGLFTGVTVAIVIWFFFCFCVQTTRLSIAAIYWYTWSRYTVDEITETLAGARGLLKKGDPETTIINRANAAFYLEHVAECLERYLPSYLASSSSQPRFDQMAAAVRGLARCCLFARATENDAIRKEVSRMMVSNIQGQWGDWRTAATEGNSRTARWRLGLAGTSRLLLGALPIALIVSGVLYLDSTNSSSAMLKPEILGPLLVAAFGFFTATLAHWIDPKRDKRESMRTKQERVKG